MVVLMVASFALPDAFQPAAVERDPLDVIYCHLCLVTSGDAYRIGLYHSISCIGYRTLSTLTALTSHIHIYVTDKLSLSSR